jgi:hypothetical protein
MLKEETPLFTKPFCRYLGLIYFGVPDYRIDGLPSATKTIVPQIECRSSAIDRRPHVGK